MNLRRRRLVPQRLGDSEGHSSSLAKATDKELDEIKRDVATNKGALMDALLKSVVTVA